MLYTTGDTHGNAIRWKSEIDPYLKEGDTIIVNGDFGIGFWEGGGAGQQKFFDWMQTRPYTVLFIDGNHENFDLLETYPKEKWNGGWTHVIGPNIRHLMRGEIFNLEDLRVFVFGGGYSLDKAMRIEGYSWWKQEMPDEAEYAHARETLTKADHEVDIILTHTAPAQSVYYLSTLRRTGIKDNVPEERELTWFLDEIAQNTSYDRWYFGHFHVDEEIWRGQIATSDTIRDLKSGKLVRQWTSYN